MNKNLSICTFFAFIFLNFNTVLAQNKAAYIMPDIGAPGMNIYVEIFAHTDSIGAFGADGVKENTNTSEFQIIPSSISDISKIVFGPIVVSWNGRLISTQAFINPSLKPTSWKWNEGLKIPIALLQNGVRVKEFDFYVVQPCPLGDISKVTSPTTTWNGEQVLILGDGNLGMRSPRGAMIVDSLILADMKYVVSTADCDPATQGNQGYLPFILIAKGDIRGSANTVISVEGVKQDAGAGGGGGGGAFGDNRPNNNANKNREQLRGGNGFTGGGIGGVNNDGIPLVGSSFFSALGGGIGSGSTDQNNQNPTIPSWSGSSLNSVKGAQKGSYEAAGGGTGHPFGTSGKGGSNTDEIGAYGAGSGSTQNQKGGLGAYANVGGTRNNDGKGYGNKMLVPLAGGSGGASGNPQVALGGYSGSGGGGGGAIAIYTYGNNRNYKIRAKGCNGEEASDKKANGGSGSGGGVILGSKFIINVDSVNILGGNCGADTAGYGYFRSDAPMKDFFAPSIWDKINTPIISGSTTDTSSYVGKNKMKTITGSYNGGDLELYIKNERNAWKLLTTIPVGNNSWSYDLNENDFGYDGDSLFFIALLQKIDNPNASTYGNVPTYIMSQMAANILKVEKTPYIVKVNDLKRDTAVMNCPNTQISFDVQIVGNGGDADLIIWKDKISNKVNWGNTVITGSKVTIDAKGNYIISPKDSSCNIKVTYTVPEGMADGKLYDTLKVWHNDSLRPNPWNIPVELNLESIATDNIDKVTDKILKNINLGSFCYQKAIDIDTAFIVTNNTNNLLHLKPYTIDDSNIKVDIADTTLMPLGGSTEVKVTLKANSIPIGNYEYKLIKHYTECDSYSDTIKIQYVVNQTNLSFIPSLLNFDKVRVGTDSIISVKLKNSSTYSIPLEDSYFSTKTLDYKLLTTIPALPYIIKPNEEIEIKVRFAPTKVQVGIVDTLVVAIPEMASICENVTKLPLIGTGTGFSLVADKYEMDFGITDCEDYRIDTVWVKNTSVTVENVSLVTPAKIIQDIAGTFTIVEQPSNGTIIKTGDSVRYVVKANRISDNIGKVITGKLLMHADSIMVNLKFEVDNPLIEVIENPIDFGTIQLGSNSKQSVTIRNLGKLPKAITNFYAKIKDVDYTFDLPLPFSLIDYVTFEVTAIPKLTAAADTFEDSLAIKTNCSTFEYSKMLKGEITSAKINISTLDFGNTSPCDEVELSGNIKNIGQTTININEVFGIEGNDKTLFRIISTDAVPVTLSSNQVFNFKVKFDPTSASAGDKQAKLSIKIFADGAEQIISVPLKGHVSPGIISIPTNPDFGDVYVHFQEQINVRLENTGELPILINNVYLKHNNVGFTLGTPITNYLLEYPQHIYAAIKFDAQSLDEKYDTLMVAISYQSCNDTLKIPVKAKVIPNNKLHITATDHKLVDTKKHDYRIPIKMSLNPNPLSKFKLDEISLEFDRTLFYPTSVTRGDMSISLNGGRRVVTVKNILIDTLAPDTTVTLFEMVGDVMIGSTDSTDIAITNVAYMDKMQVGEVVKKSGSFTIKTCNSGGERLINYSESAPWVKVINNPVTGTLEVECQALEVGNHSLQLVDVGGYTSTIKEWVTASSGEKHTYSIAMNSFSNGVYQLVMQTPTARYKTNFVLTKNNQ